MSALKEWQRWFGSRPSFAVGSLSFPSSSTGTAKEKGTTTEVDVRAFLDNALNENGPNSVVYIAFGSLWWPAEPEKLWALLDVLMEERKPFVSTVSEGCSYFLPLLWCSRLIQLLSHTSPVAVVPEEINEKIMTSGLGYHASWLPQQLILRHPVRPPCVIVSLFRV